MNPTSRAQSTSAGSSSTRSVGPSWRIRPATSNAVSTGERTCLVPVVRDEHGRGVQPVQHGAQVGEQVGAGGGVQPGERLVEQQHAGRHSERTGDRDPLCLAAGERARGAGGEVPDAQRVQPRSGPAPRLPAPDAAQPQAGRRVRRHGPAAQDRPLQHGRHRGPQLA